MIPSYYEFYAPVKILSGHKALENIPYELQALGGSRPLVVTDKGVVEAGLIEHFQKALYSSEITIGALYDTVPPDSSSLVVNEVAAVYQKNHCDSIIAIGGGSPIDTAKGANILISEDGIDLMDFMGSDVLHKPMRPLLVIPTTSGTGSEVTNVAVISDTARNVKMAFASGRLLPDVAILDSRMTLTLPAKMTAATGMDAMTHAVEAYTGLQKNPMSDAYAIAAIELLASNLCPAVDKGKDKELRLILANAATMAGIAFSNSMVGVVHALGHATGAVSHIPHGVAMSIFLPHGLEYNFTEIEDRLAKLLLYLGGTELYTSTVRAERGSKTIALIREMQQRLFASCQLPRTLQEAGVAEDQLGAIAKTAIDDGATIFNVKELGYEDALKILKKAY